MCDCETICEQNQIQLQKQAKPKKSWEKNNSQRWDDTCAFGFVVLARVH